MTCAATILYCKIADLRPGCLDVTLMYVGVRKTLQLSFIPRVSSRLVCC